MKTGKVSFFYRLRPNIFCLIPALPFLLVFAVSAHAFQFGEGDFEGSLDSTISYGQSWRVAKQDKDIIGTDNGGRAYSVNGDDGNLNYNRSLISNVAKMTSELELRYQNFGCFVRGTGFYDFENERSRRERTQLTSEARDLVGRSVDLLDAYVWANFDIGPMPLNFRVGEQVVSWGESTFIQNGINVINPYNVSALRLPGSELKEALVPEGMVWFSLGITENVSFEGIYLYDWEETVIDPPGSYWSTNDFLGQGGKYVLLGWGDVSDQGTDLGILGFDPNFLMVPRASARKADNQGQWGMACRVFAPELNNTEFGLFFLRYHSRLPCISGITGTLAGYSAALGIITNPIIPASVRPSLAVDAYAGTSFWLKEYPEYINMYGLSFNTLLAEIAVQGEVSYRDDLPLIIDDVEQLITSLSVLDFLDPITQYSRNQIGNQAGNYSTYIPGYILRDVTQAQITATKFFGPSFLADQTVLLGELGMTYVHDMPSKKKLRLEAPGTYTSGNSVQGPTGWHSGKPAVRSKHFADQTSCGYIIVTRFDYNNAFQAVNISPRIVWRHDFYGNTPSPIGNFLEGRKAISVGVNTVYQQKISFDLSYSNFFGAGKYNLINDRDIIAFNLKYSF